MDIQLRATGGDPAPDASMLVGASYVPMIGDEVDLGESSWRVTNVITETNQKESWPTPGQPLWHHLDRLIVEVERIVLMGAQSA